MSKNAKIVTWIARLIVAAIFLMSAVPKFTGDAMSVGIFEALGVEPWGRFLTGIIEVLATVLILAPATVGIGAALAAVTMIGALVSHVAVLGFEGDYGMAAGMAVVVLIASGITATAFKHQIPGLGG